MFFVKPREYRVVKGSWNYFEVLLGFVIKLTSYAGVCLLGLLGLLLVTDVCLRFFFGKPISGSTEVVEFMLVLVVFASLASTTLEKGHVCVDLLLSRFSEKTQAFADAFTYSLSSGLWILISWRGFVQAQVLRRSGRISGTLSIPEWPLLLVVSACGGLVALVLLCNVISSLGKVLKK